MSSRLENVTVVDSNAIASAIMNDLVDVESMERTLKTDLSTADLFKIDCAILSSLRKTQDFSRELLEQLESGKIETIMQKPQKQDIVSDVQLNAMLDIVYPLQDMFDSFANIVIENLN